MTDSGRYFIAGGAGFIGSHFTDRLLADPLVTAVTLYDNFSSGREWHYEHHRDDPRLRVMRNDVKDLDALTEAMQGHGVVIHLASNPDIALLLTMMSLRILLTAWPMWMSPFAYGGPSCRTKRGRPLLASLMRS